MVGALWAIGLSFPMLSPILPAAQATPGCGPNDRPETGIAGQVPLADQLNGRADYGYNCGLALVGYNSLGQRGGNANMAWSGRCAYVAGDKGIAVVDVSDPTKPRVARTLHGKGSDVSVETIGAVDAGSRRLLAVGRYGAGGHAAFPTSGPVDIYDTTDCAKPKLLAEFSFPGNTHNLTFSADGTLLFSTIPLQVADVTNPRAPKFIRSLDDDLRAQGITAFQNAHEAVPSPDGTRLYIGGQTPPGEQLLILDIRDIRRRPATVVGRTPLPGHSISLATMSGKRFLLNADESVLNLTAKGCLPEKLNPAAGAAQPYLTDISNERAPQRVSRIRLPINEPENCAQQVADNSNSSVHYHDVDDPNRTTFAMLSMWNAGLRIVDVRNPAGPREVAYFNPGRFQFSRPLQRFRTPDGFGRFVRMQSASGLDQAWAHSRYVPDSGQIWMTTQSGGFWVLELEPQVRAALGLPAKTGRYPDGRAPRPAFTQLRVGNLQAKTAS